MSRRPRVTVVVAARDAAHHLPGLMEALRRQTLPLDQAQLLLVDDGSGDDTRAIAEASGLFRVLPAPGHVGLPVARNIGIAQAVADVVALTDADCRPDHEWLERGLGYFDRGEADLLAGAIRVPLGERPSIATLLDASRFFDQERYVRGGSGAGANLWVRRWVFDAAGLFNERLASYGGDDTEFSHRAIAAGARLTYAPDVLISHPPRARLRDLARKAYRLGFGFAAQRRHAVGPLQHTPRLYLSRAGLLPDPPPARVERLVRAGYAPTARERGLLWLGAYLFVRLPRTAGDLVGERHQRRLARTADPPSAG